MHKGVYEMGQLKASYREKDVKTKLVKIAVKES